MSIDYKMPRGFPRPFSEKFKVPTPYTADSPENPGSIASNRTEECVSDRLCSVCGLELGEKCHVAATKKEHCVEGIGGVSVIDPGVCHEKCAKITSVMCPQFKKGNAYFLKNYNTDAVMKALKYSRTSTSISRNDFIKKYISYK